MINYHSFTKNQKIGILLVGLFTIILFFGCISFQNDIEVISKAIEEKNPSLCSTLSLEISVDSCYAQVFESLKNELTAEKCSEFGLKWKDTCFDNVGRTQLKAQYCNEIKNSSIRTECRNFVTETLEKTRFEQETEEPTITKPEQEDSEPEVTEEPVLLTAEEVEKIVLEDLHFDAVNSVAENFFQGQPIFKVTAYQYRELTETTSTLLTITLYINAETGEKTGQTQTLSQKTLAFNKSNAISKAKQTESIDTILKILHKVTSKGQVQYIITGNRTIWETDRKYHVEKMEVSFDEKGQLIQSTILETTETQLSDTPFIK